MTDHSDAFVVASGRSDLFGVFSGDGPKPAGIFIPTTSWDATGSETSDANP